MVWKKWRIPVYVAALVAYHSHYNQSVLVGLSFHVMLHIEEEEAYWNV
jgi:hypothetical protein